MAAAARLARLGHQVQLGLGGIPLGGVWAPAPETAIAVDAMPPVFTLPALWRDLFKKTGRPLAGSAGSAGLELVPAAWPTHHFSDGTRFSLPSERGQQYYAIEGCFGLRAAEQWRDLLDELDELWLLRRRFGIESTEKPTSRQQRAALWLDRSLADLADRLDCHQLASIVLSLGPRNGTDSSKAPALLAVDLVLERTFGRWQLLDREGVAAPASALIKLLADRLAERGVEIVDEVKRPDLVALPHRPRRQVLHRAPRPALAPEIRHDMKGSRPSTGIRELVDHTGDALRVTWRRVTSAGVVSTTHDYSNTVPDLGFGLAPDHARAWLHRVPVDGDTIRASSCSPAGNGPWAELASAAQATYLLHERITGVDPSPKNKAFEPPALRELNS